MIKNAGKVLAILLAALMLFGCVSKAEAPAPGMAPVARELDKEYSLVLLHTNDHHGATLSKDGAYGLAERATYIKSVRAANKDVLLLDAGDINTGTALSNMFAAEPDILAYNAMGYDAVAFGNHEFDGSLAKLTKQIEQSAFTWVASNVRTADGFLGEPYIIRDYEGFRVGVIGMATLRSLTIASPDSSLTFDDEIVAANEYTKLLKENFNCDIIILVGHLGTVLEEETQNTSIKVAENTTGIDIIVDGHSHTKMEEPLVVNGTYIVSSNEWGKFVGTGKLTVKNGELVGFDWKAEEITSEKYAPDAEVTSIIEPFAVKAEASLKDVVLKTTDEFIFGNKLSRKIETALGDLVADAQVEYLRGHNIDVDFGFTNGGNIRAALPKGDVTRENIMTVLPFENYVYVVTLKGSDVIELFDFIGSINQGAGGFAQMSKEIRYTLTYDADGANGKISDLTFNGAPIDANRTYRIAVNDYLAGGGDGYTTLTKSVDTFNTSMLMSDVVIEFAQTLGDALSPVTDGRITVIGGISLD